MVANRPVFQLPYDTFNKTVVGFFVAWILNINRYQNYNYEVVRDFFSLKWLWRDIIKWASVKHHAFLN